MCFFPDGFMQSDVFVCSGNEDVFEQRFAYYGYRYCYVWGITESQATDELLTAIEAYSDIKQIGDFTCSDDDANRLYHMVQRSDITNFVYFLTDCPHREKNGWTGDISLSAEHVMLSYDGEKSLREWLLHLRKSQTEEGELPGVAPNTEFGYGNYTGPTWDGVLFNVPYVLWVYRKNTDVILENAHAMLRYLEFISRKRDENGMVAHGRLGDWCPVGGNAVSWKIPLELTQNLMLMDICDKASKMFDAVSLNMHKNFADTLYAEVRDAARKYIDFDTMTVKGNCQSSQAMALYYGLFDETEKQKAFSVLLDIIHRDGNSMQGGILCLRVLFHVLSEFGESELAYNMICKREYPSYGYLLDKGFTTLPESFPKDYTNAETSFNHHFFGDISHWFVRHVAGINILNDKIVIKPNFIKKLDFAKASYELSDGSVLKVSWERRDDKKYIVKISGAKTEFIVPNGCVLKSEKDGLFEIEKN